MQIRLLGDLRVERDGQPVALPASKRTRALLGYLVASGAPQSRQSLCDLLWDGPDDPRASLRWSLTKLRSAVDEPDAPRIRADRERVGFVAHHAWIDTVAAAALLDGGVAQAPLHALEQAAALLSAEFLDGLDLPACYRYHQWCMAERERCGALRRQVLSALIERLQHEPEAALMHARALVAADPLSESAHAALLRLLARAGRHRDAEAHYREADSMFRRELGHAPGAELRAAMAASRSVIAPMPASIRPVPPDAAPVRREMPAAEPVTSLPIVGRAAEQAAIRNTLEAVARSTPRELLLFAGEPGIGKTRLLEALSQQAANAGFLVLQARCFEAEMTRPYGGWVDALRGLPPQRVPERLRADLAPLLVMPAQPAPRPAVAPSLGQPNGYAQAGERSRLFDAVAELLRNLAASQPVVAIFDDLQWIDESSSSLLHYVARSATSDQPLLLAAAARAGEIDDNAGAVALLHSLARERRLRRIDLAPLQPDDVAMLLAGARSALDASAVHRASGGNPLFALTLVRTHAESPESPADASLLALIGYQLQRLDASTRELLVWASAIGHAFDPQWLCAVLAQPEAELLGRLERLERRGMLQPAGDGLYDFAHDLVREAAYRSMSQPRRRAVHRRFAQMLQQTALADPSACGELMHHASQASDPATTVQAAIGAAEHCLRVFANRQALETVERGLAQLQRLPAGPQRAVAEADLLRLEALAAGPGAPGQPQRIDALRNAVDAAESFGQHAVAVAGLHIISWLTFQSNDIDRTVEATLEAERVSRSADPTTRCAQLAGTAQCMIQVEADVPRARALVAQADALAAAANLQLVQLDWAKGVLARWDGDLDAAQARLRRAIALARLRGDHWPEFECLVWLAKIELERERFEAVDPICGEIREAASRMSHVSAIADALQALAHRYRDPAAERNGLDAAVHELRALDDQASVAYVLNHCAAIDLQRGELERAAAEAADALRAATIVSRASDIVIASATAACVACAAGDRAGAAAQLARASAQATPATAGARALQWVARAQRAVGARRPADSNARSNARPRRSSRTSI
ncbi:MAG TPA: AAA family ATPase [Burkholderiaceae bacterium]|nr:AAA family ATPase [Burkholderiaceae bacterium]